MLVELIGLGKFIVTSFRYILGSERFYSRCGRDERPLVRCGTDNDKSEAAPTGFRMSGSSSLPFDLELDDVDGADVGGLQGGLQDGIGRE